MEWTRSNLVKRLGIIGFPIGHSISPVFQQAALDHFELDASYTSWEVPPGDLDRFINDIRCPDLIGINVTVPHKESVISLIDDIDDWALRAGAVNTIVNRNGRLIGYNTDGIGFLRGLRHNQEFDLNGKTILVIGAGGAARGVILALSSESIGHLIIANRTLERAQTLVNIAQEIGVSSQAISLDWQELSLAAAQSSLIINCTSVGMAHTPEENISPLLIQQIPPTCLVYDLVYNPLETQLLREAARAGAATMNGIKMLVYQGAESFERWFEKTAPVRIMLDAADGAISRMWE